MLTIWGNRYHPFCDAISRRDFFKVGILGLGGLTLADLLRLEAQGSNATRPTHKSVIMVYLPGGPSHIDMYDMKPQAPVEIRGEFKPIKTNVPGIDICELMPRQATMADKFAIVRGFQTSGTHDSTELTTGFSPGAHRPAFGSVVSRLQGDGENPIPPYVSLIVFSNHPFGEEPTYLGAGHKPFTPSGPGMADLRLARGLTLSRLADRKSLLHSFDTMRRDVDDARGTLAGMDRFKAQALDMITSPKVAAAFDLNRESPGLRDRYGRRPASEQFLLARRLVEAGVRVVTLAAGWDGEGELGSSSNISNWDTHRGNFKQLRKQLPELDRSLSALITDLHDRGLDNDVAVVVCGEMGRTPRIGKSTGADNGPDGRDHWGTGFALLAGGGLRMGQVVGETDRYAERAKGIPHSPQNLLATLYHVLGIDPTTTLADYSGRPQYLLDDRQKIEGLL